MIVGLVVLLVGAAVLYAGVTGQSPAALLTGHHGTPGTNRGLG